MNTLSEAQEAYKSATYGTKRGHERALVEAMNQTLIDEIHARGESYDWYALKGAPQDMARAAK